MFQALQPLLAERSLHILLSATKDGKINAHIAPVKKNDAENDAFVTPFHCTATAAELDAELPAVVAQWIGTRQQVTTSLAEALAAAESDAKKAVEDAKKKAADKNKKVTPPITKAASVAPAKPATKAVVTPSLLDGAPGSGGDDGEDDEAGGEAAAAQTAAADPVAAAPVVAAAEPTVAPVVAQAPTEAPAPAVATVATAAVTTAPVPQELF